ncbi:MAG: DUF1963 domain-containing protein [Pseudomonadota bacterium]
MPRDTPPVALPAIAFFEDRAATDTALRTGGRPRLPDDLDWPALKDGTPYHFFAEIDLARLPRDVVANGQSFPMPNCPATGLLFVFLPLHGDNIYDADPVVLFAPDAAAITPERALPDTLTRLDDDEIAMFSDQARLTPEATGFAPTFYETRAIMSARAENPLWRNMDRAALSEEEVYERDLAFAKQLRALGIDYNVPLPTPEAAREDLFHEIPDYYQGFFNRGVFQWTWEYIFEVAKRAFADCHDLPIEEIEGWIEDGDDRPRYHRVIKALRTKKTKIEHGRFSDRPGWWESFACDHVPSLDMRVDVQFARWMGYARVMQKHPLTDADKRAFIALLDLVEHPQDPRGPANLRVLTQFREHGVKKFYVEQVLHHAFKKVAKDRADLHPGRDIEPRHDFGDDARAAQNIQMFGAGYLMQNAAVDQEDKVLLFQVSNGGGLTLGEIDGILQLWIDPDALASGDFGKAFATFETT